MGTELVDESCAPMGAYAALPEPEHLLSLSEHLARASTFSISSTFLTRQVLGKTLGSGSFGTVRSSLLFSSLLFSALLFSSLLFFSELPS